MSAGGATPVSGDWEALARGAASRAPEAAELDLRRELLTFRLEQTHYAVPIERVREIVRVHEITPVPRVPKWVRGGVALRGEIVQVVDLRMRIGLQAVETERSSRIIVLHGDDESVSGMLVDAVHDVLRAREDSIRPVSGGEVNAVVELCERDGEFVSILDVDRLMGSNED